MENPQEMHEILPWLFLGSRHARSEEKEFKSNNIGLCLDLSKLADLPVFEGTRYERFDIEDRDTVILSPVLSEVCVMIERWRTNNREEKGKSTNVFVHCNQGISRSASVVIGYLIKHENMNLKTAFRHVKDRRRIIMPNVGFWRQLVVWEEECRGETSLVLGKYGQLQWK